MPPIDKQKSIFIKFLSILHKTCHKVGFQMGTVPEKNKGNARVTRFTFSAAISKSLELKKSSIAL